MNLPTVTNFISQNLNLIEHHFSPFSQTTQPNFEIVKMIVSIAEEMNPSCRTTMEDCFAYFEPGSWNCNNPNLAYFGVYDGHGGRDTVDYLSTYLHSNIATELNIESDSSTSLHQKIESAFLITDVESHMAGINSSGATVAISLVERVHNKVTIHAANCGDARIVLSKGVKRLTRDHKAEDTPEVKRIDSNAGFVFRNRVLGIMAVSRSLGDHCMKQFVIGQPHVSTTEILLEPCDVSGEQKFDQETENNDEFIILACDGLWDCLTDEEAVELVKRYVREEDPTRKDSLEDRKRTVAQCLAHTALQKGSTGTFKLHLLTFIIILLVHSSFFTS